MHGGDVASWEIGFIFIIVLLFFATALEISREWERGVILRLGKFQAARGSDITFVLSLLERMRWTNTRVGSVQKISRN